MKVIQDLNAATMTLYDVPAVTKYNALEQYMLNTDLDSMFINQRNFNDIMTEILDPTPAVTMSFGDIVDAVSCIEGIQA